MAAELQFPRLRLLTFFAGGLFAATLLTMLYVGHKVVIPLMFAFILKLFFEPAIRLLQQKRVPRVISAILILLGLIGLCLLLGEALSGPATSWAKTIPDSIPRLQARLTHFRAPIRAIQEFLSSAEHVTAAARSDVVAVSIEGSSLSDRLLTGTRALVGGLFTTLLMLFFLMVSGDTFLRRIIEVLPRFEDKIQVVEISQHIERDIAAYLMTITILNALVGIATGMIAAVFGIADPALWAVVAFFLNYIPVAGPLLATALVAFLGSVIEPPLHYALLPAICYFLLHTVESNMITPQLLAKRFTLNPVLVILSLIFWFWMWGVPGAVLSTPILAITKIVCSRIERLSAIGHFLEA